MRTRSLLFVTTVLAVGLPARGGRPTGKGPCDKAEQCDGGVCVAVDGEAYCSMPCGPCPAGMYCDARLFSEIGLKVCLRGRSDAPVAPKTPPRLPCAGDESCPGPLVCAAWRGQRDCTLPCTSDAQCAGPDMGGVKVDLLSCQPDEVQPRRGACLPRSQCAANPLACVGASEGSHSEVRVQVPGFGLSLDVRTSSGEDPDPEPEVPMDHGGGPTEMRAPPPAPRAPPTPMSPTRFSRLLGQLRVATFVEDRRLLLTTAAQRDHFRCRQLGRILAVLEFSEERLEAVRLLRPRLVDLDNAHEVLSRLEFGADRVAAARILGEE